MNPREARYARSHREPALDRAGQILAGEPTISNEDRANLWDLYHDAKDSTDLAQHLQSLSLHPDLKQRLFDTKKAAEPAPSNLDRAVAAIHRVSEIDPNILELAEKHTGITKALIDTVLRGEN